MEGNLVVVLNQPKRRIECLNFAEVVFDFSSDAFVVCNKDPRLDDTVAVVNKKAYDKGRNFLKVNSIEEAVALFHPDKTLYVDSQKREMLEVTQIISDLSADKTVMLIFGERYLEAERLGSEIAMNHISSAAVVLYEIHRVRKRW